MAKTRKISKKQIKDKLKKKIPEERYFVLVSGQKVKNVKELADVLESLDETNFLHHVNEHRNDFANWIQDVFEEFDLAEKLKTSVDKKKTRMIIYKHICNSFW